MELLPHVKKQTCDYNEQLTHSWLKHNICAIQELEIRTRALIVKREQGDNPRYDKKCRYYHLSASRYFPVRHNEVDKELYNVILPESK